MRLHITVELNTSRVLITALNIYMGNLLCKMQIKLVTHTCSYDHTDKLLWSHKIMDLYLRESMLSLMFSAYTIGPKGYYILYVYNIL